MGHAGLNLTIRDLAKATGFHRNTLRNIDGRYAGKQDSISLIDSVFRKAGGEFYAFMNLRIAVMKAVKFSAVCCRLWPLRESGRPMSRKRGVCAVDDLAT